MSDEPQRPRRRRPRPEQRARSSARHWTDYLPLAALAAFVLAVALVVVMVAMWLAPAGSLVSVPAFIGIALDRAQVEAAGHRLGVRVVAHRTDFRIAKGVIIGQLPSAGEKVREGRVIDVIVSDGVPLVAVPNLSNLSLRDARLALGNAHLILGTVATSTNLDVTSGQILEQHPDPFTTLPAGSSVDVTVARGRPVLYAPNFVGMNYDFAKRAAKDADVVLGAPTWMPIRQGARPKGTVIAQDPAAGTIMGTKRLIALQISGGGPETPTPSPSPTQSAEAGQPSPSPPPSPSPSPILPSPGAPRTMRVSIALPQSDVAKPVKVVLLDATGSKTIFDQTTTGGITITVDLTVVGDGTIETYVDGKLVTSTPL